MSRNDREEVFAHRDRPPAGPVDSQNQWVVARNAVAGLYAIALAIREVAAAIREHKT